MTVPPTEMDALLRPKNNDDEDVGVDIESHDDDDDEENDDDDDDDDGRPQFRSLDFDRIVNSYSTAATRARNNSKRLASHRFDLTTDSFSSSFDAPAAADFDDDDDDDDDNDEKVKAKDEKEIGTSSDALEDAKEQRRWRLRHKHKHKEGHHVLSHSGFTATRWILTFFVGLLTGLTAVFVIYFVERIIEFRVQRLNLALQAASIAAARRPSEEPRTSEGYDDRHDIDDNDETPSLRPLQLSLPQIYLAYTTFNLLLVSISAALCLHLAPAAVGSGIPEVKSYLNGIRVGTFGDLSVFWVKLIGTIFSVSSGLVVGPEGPVVHLGSVIGAVVTKTGDLELKLRTFRQNHPRVSSCVGCADHKRIDRVQIFDNYNSNNHNNNNDNSKAAQQAAEEDITAAKKQPFSYSSCGGCSSSCFTRCGFRCENSLFSSLLFYLSHFRNDAERRSLISIGAAAGFASAFGAPVGGLLYSLEEASSFFSHDMLWRTLFGTAVATCCIAVYHGDFTRYSMLSLEIGVQEESLLARFTELPLYFVVGIAGGLLGGGYNSVYALANRLRKKFYDSVAHDRRGYLGYKMAEVGLVSIVTSVCMMSVPLHAGWACRDVRGDDKELEEYMFEKRYNCPEGSINEIGSILFGSREESIKDILTNPGEFDPRTLLTVGILFISLMTITFGTSVPSGMFMPTVLSGACFGGYAGLMLNEYVNSTVHPSDFALIGAAAFLAGMQRNTVSLCVILMEGTGQTKVIIPVIITVVCARMVGDLFSEGVYEIGIEQKGYPFLEHTSRAAYDMFSALHVMSKNFETVAMVETVADIESLLLHSNPDAFPVVDGRGHYRGMIRRDQLIAVLKCRIFMETTTDGTRTNSVAMQQTKVVKFQSQATFADIAVVAAGGGDDDDHGDDDGSGAAENTSIHVARRWQVLDHLYEIHHNQQEIQEWNPNAVELVSPWLRDNVLSSSAGNHVMFGMDETLPNGMIISDGGSSRRDVVVKEWNGDDGGRGDKKLVAFVAPELKTRHVDVAAMMNRAALSVSEEYPLSKTYDLFVSMGLRHLPVLSSDGKVAGMITRSVLLDEHVTEKTGYKLY